MLQGPIPQERLAQTDVSFADLGLSEELVAELEGRGFLHPTLIQAEVIPVALDDRDVIGLAVTGSGKTAAFTLPILDCIEPGDGVQALIVSPTREIAHQTHAFVEAFGQAVGLRSALVIGGLSMGKQIDRLRSRPEILVVTPGRLLDHARRRNVDLRGVTDLVLDEADHMLDLGFIPQIQEILELLPADRRVLMFSATMPPPVERLASRFMDHPARVDVLPETRTASGIDHRLYLVSPNDKKACAVSLIENNAATTLVFIRRKIDAEWLCRVLEKEGYPVERIHSDRSQAKRMRALRGFREGKHRILVATDVAARGLDIPHIEHVVNFDLPDTVEDYIHRAGRTARGDLKGRVSSIATWQDKPTIRLIEREIGQRLNRSTAPGVEPYKDQEARVRRRKRSLRR